jgi:LmbE family N-acetylglucosaminyl deacetylase
MNPRDGRLVAISPHYDDAVFGVGAALAASRAATVITVLGGGPRPPPFLTPWDAKCGFRLGDDVVGARRAEDREALDTLHVGQLWLEFWDAQYQQPPTDQAVAAGLARALRAVAPETVFFPLGLFHSDHHQTHAAARSLRRRFRHVQWVVYADALYRDVDRLLEDRLAELHAEGFQLDPLDWRFPESARRQKRAAAQRYRSQLRGLAGGRDLGDLDQPETYWEIRSRRRGTRAR